MATGADADNWSIGRLEGDIAALKEGQREIKDSLAEVNRRLDSGLREARVDLDEGLRETNRRIDRLFYAALAIGGALLATTLGIAATLAIRLFGG